MKKLVSSPTFLGRQSSPTTTSFLVGWTFEIRTEKGVPVTCGPTLHGLIRPARFGFFADSLVRLDYPSAERAVIWMATKSKPGAPPIDGDWRWDITVTRDGVRHNQCAP